MNTTFKLLFFVFIGAGPQAARPMARSPNRAVSAAILGHTKSKNNHHHHNNNEVPSFTTTTDSRHTRSDYQSEASVRAVFRYDLERVAAWVEAARRRAIVRGDGPRGPL